MIVSGCDLVRVRTSVALTFLAAGADVEGLECVYEAFRLLGLCRGLVIGQIIGSLGKRK